MVGSPPEIVSFTAPPVAEVVTSVGFTSMRVENFLAIQSLHDSAWRQQFPRTEQQAPYEVPIETFDRPQPPRFEWGVATTPPLPRIWYISESGHELLQMQHDWFAANWRRQAAPAADSTGFDTYRRWERRRTAFDAHWRTLNEWIQGRGGQLLPNQYEVTYINHIVPIPGVWAVHSQASAVVPCLSANQTDVTLEQVVWRSQALLPAVDDLPPARLHVSAAPAFAAPGAMPTSSPEPTPLIVLELTVRGAPPLSGDLLSALDRGRRVIVENFLSITSDSARQAWGQK